MLRIRSTWCAPTEVDTGVALAAKRAPARGPGCGYRDSGGHDVAVLRLTDTAPRGRGQSGSGLLAQIDCPKVTHQLHDGLILFTFSRAGIHLSALTEVELVESWGLTARRSCGITGACGIHKGAS